MKLKQSFLLHHCFDKKKYNTLDEANLAGLHIIKKNNNKNKPAKMYIYLCQNGQNHFHLTRRKTKHKVI